MNFLKNNKKQKNSFYRLQSMKIYWKKCKKHTENIFPKKMVSISKNTIKEKSNVLFVWLKWLLFMKLKTGMIQKVT